MQAEANRPMKRPSARLHLARNSVNKTSWCSIRLSYQNKNSRGNKKLCNIFVVFFG